MADKPALAHAVPAPAAPVVRTRDGAFAWFTVAYGLLNFGQGVFPPLLPQIMDGLGLEFATVGLLGSAFGLARFVTDLPAGLMTERRGPLPILHAGIACLFGGTLLSAWAPSLPFMLLARALVGVGSGLTIVVSILFVMRRGPAASRTRRGNVYEIGVIGGTALSAWLGGHAAAQLGWRWGFGLAIPATASVAGFGAAATLLILGLTAWMVPPVLLAERLPGGFRGPAAGVYRLVSDFAYIIAPGSVGWLIGRHGFRATGLAMAVLFAAATGVAIAVLGRRPQHA